MIRARAIKRCLFGPFAADNRTRRRPIGPGGEGGGGTGPLARSLDRVFRGGCCSNPPGVTPAQDRRFLAPLARSLDRVYPPGVTPAERERRFLAPLARVFRGGRYTNPPGVTPAERERRVSAQGPAAGQRLHFGRCDLHIPVSDFSVERPGGSTPLIQRERPRQERRLAPSSTARHWACTHWIVWVARPARHELRPSGVDNVSNHSQAPLGLLHLNAVGHEVLRRDPARPLPAPKDAELQLERPHVVPFQRLPA